MAVELIARDSECIEFSECREPELEPGSVRLRSRLASIKHGTGFRFFDPGASEARGEAVWDPRLRLSLPATEGVETQVRACWNSMVYGEVLDCGVDVVDFAPGDRVAGFLPVRDTHVVPAERLLPAPAGVDPRSLLCLDPAEVALSGIRDGAVRLGERVAICGLGAIGLMAVQLARLAGATWVAAIDPSARRREVARELGADLLLDPSSCDAGRAIKEATDTMGVDVVIECSGAGAALHDALRAVRYAGTVVSLSFYQRPLHGVMFGGEWHRNRIRLISSRGNSEPGPEYGWSHARLRRAAWDLIVRGFLRGERVIDPVVPMAEAGAALRLAQADPNGAIKLGIRFDGPAS